MGARPVTILEHFPRRTGPPLHAPPSGANAQRPEAPSNADTCPEGHTDALGSEPQVEGASEGC